jgi:DNA-directed RNA polymerase subunit RPC12/RpoP
MAITFDCTCGQPLEVEDEHAGKQAKCPRCGESVTIPSAGEEEEPKCPGCGKPMEYDAIICMECGFNRKTGRRLTTGGKLPKKKARKGEEEIPDESPIASSFSKSFESCISGFFTHAS